MRSRILLFISRCLYYCGLIVLARWWTRRSGQYLVILNYHRAAGQDLRRHLLYLRRHFRILHLETALEELYTSSTVRFQRKDRRTPLVLTFDDGYYDNYTHGFMLACELQVPITIFLIPGYLEIGNCFWWLDRIVRHARVDNATIEGRTYHLNQQVERKLLAQAIDTRLNSALSVAEQKEFLIAVRTALAVPSSIVLEEEPAPLLNWTQVREMEESSWVSFGAHTMYHSALAYLTDLTEVQREVGECRAVLEQRLGHPMRTFAYPYGKLEHIGDNGPCAVQKAGYDWAVTTIPGFNTARSNPYLLRRVFADANQHWLLIALKTSGMWGFFFRMSRIPALLIRQRPTRTIQR